MNYRGEITEEFVSSQTGSLDVIVLICCSHNSFSELFSEVDNVRMAVSSSPFPTAHHIEFLWKQTRENNIVTRFIYTVYMDDSVYSNLVPFR